MLKSYSFVLIFVTISFACEGQRPIDSVMNIISDLAIDYPDSAYDALQTIEKNVDHYDTPSQLAFHKKATYFFKKRGDFKSEAEHWRKYIRLSTNRDSTFLYAIQLALAEQNNAQYDSALYHLNGAIDYFLGMGDFPVLAVAYEGIANVYTRLNKFTLATKYYLKAIEIFEFYENNERLSYAYMNLSNLYLMINEHDKCLETRRKAYNFASDTDNEALKHLSEFNLGTSYVNSGKLDSSMQLLQSAKQYYESISDMEILNVTYNSLAHLYFIKNQLDSAEIFMEKAISIIRLGESDLTLSNSLANYGQVLIEKGDFKKGIKICQEAYLLARKNGNFGMESYCAECLYFNFKGNKQYDSALFYFELKNLLEDSLDLYEAQKTALTTQLTFEHQKETNLITQTAKQEIKQQEAWSKMLILAVAILILGILVLFFALRQRRKSMQLVAREKEYLDNLLHNLVHEFRTPLTLIEGPVNDLIKADDQNKLLKMVSRNSNRMLELVNQVLDFAKIKAGRLEIKNELTNIQIFVQDIVDGFTSHASSKKIGLSVHFETTSKLIKIDSDKLYKIISNLISNAVKYTTVGGEIKILVALKNGVLKINVIDNGIGLSKENTSRIFDKFYQVDASTTRKGEGTGLGLAFVKELVDLMGGKIGVHSSLGEGSDFFVILPVDKVSSDNLTISSEVQIPQTEKLDQSASFSSEERPTILVIEDNTDLRDYLKYLLSSDYNVLEAENGQQGIDIATEKLPDFVISDVMMPLKDGYQVVSELKQDPRTEHIPIIVLTAKASYDSKLKGLELGADDYLSKPFSSDELRLRIANQLKLQQNQWLKYQEGQGPIADSKTTEHPFIEDLRHKILDQKEESFSADELAALVALSRSQLHRKLKSLTGLSATAFVNRVKLESAFQDILRNNQSISEIAYSYGYSDPAYFSKLFKKTFGKSPSDLA